MPTYLSYYIHPKYILFIVLFAHCSMRDEHIVFLSENITNHLNKELAAYH